MPAKFHCCSVMSLFRFFVVFEGESEAHLRGQRLLLLLVGPGVLDAGLTDIRRNLVELSLLLVGGLLETHHGGLGGLTGSALPLRLQRTCGGLDLVDLGLQITRDPFEVTCLLREGSGVSLHLCHAGLLSLFPFLAVVGKSSGRTGREVCLLLGTLTIRRRRPTGLPRVRHPLRRPQRGPSGPPWCFRPTENPDPWHRHPPGRRHRSPMRRRPPPA